MVVDDRIARLPKVELHLHGEADARLDRLLSHRAGRDPFDWSSWRDRVSTDVAPGMARLHCLRSARLRSEAEVEALDANSENFIERIRDALDEAGADGAIYAEVRFGAGTLRQPEFLPLFREAELRAQQRWPRLRAEAVVSGLTPARSDRWEQLLPHCLDAASKGLAGIDIIPEPYDTEANWRGVGKWTARLAEAGLGITVHAGEFSTANIVEAVRLPGVSRLGHAVYAAADAHVLDAVQETGVTIECCLSSNVLFGAVRSYEEHPVRRLMHAGIRVTLNSDDPVRVCTSIGREYAIAATLGFTVADLLDISHNAVRASFTTSARKRELLEDLSRFGFDEGSPDSVMNPIIEEASRR